MSRKNKLHKPESIEKMKISQAIAKENLLEESRLKILAGAKSPKPESMKRKTSERIRGEANPFYIDGRCSGENYVYPLGWSSSLKETVRNRDERKCRICSKTEEENGKKLDVHHINYDKTGLSFLNLISLCKSCHKKTNPKGRRDHYQTQLSQLLLQDIPLEMRFIGRQDYQQAAA